MRARVLFGTLLIGVLAVSAIAAVAPARKAVAVHFRRPTIVVTTLIQGAVVFEHDDERMARGEACTRVYKFDNKRRERGEMIVEFHCTPKDRTLATTFEAVTSRGEGAGPDRLMEYQFAGETEGHGVPAY
jgi:hypothetical protein